MPTTTLEEDVEKDLIDLDILRKRSAKLRDAGLQAIMAAPPITENPSADWKILDDVVEASLLVKTLRTPYPNPPQDLQEQELQEKLTTIMKAPAASSLSTLLPTPGSKIEEIEGRTVNSKIPIFQAARLLQALLTIPALAFSRGALTAFYIIVREIYSAQPPDWAFGGARAGDGGHTSTFVTDDCIRPIVRLSRGLGALAELLESLSKLNTYLEHVRQNRSLPPKWRRIEIRRLYYRLCTEVGFRRQEMPLDLPHSDLRDLCFCTDSTLERSLESYIEGTLRSCRLAGQEAEKNARKVRSEIEEGRNKESRELKEALAKKKKGKDRPGNLTARELEHSFARAQTGHLIALRAIRNIGELGETIRESAESSGEGLSHKLKKIRLALLDASSRLLQLLEPARVFASSILDRQLAAASLGLRWDPAELVFAAVSYGWASQGPTDEAWDDERLIRAADVLQGVLKKEGRFPSGKPIFATPDGFLLVVSGSEILRAFSELIRRLGGRTLDAYTAKRMLAYFEDLKRPLRGKEDAFTWSHEEPDLPPRPTLWVTCLAVQALERMNAMLDTEINERIYVHFSVQKPWRNAESLKLDDLFYPDYGFADSAAGREPVVFLLYRMLAHIRRLKLGGRVEGAHSLILHGPPGTGKTTLVEALAASARLPLVQITPSDLVVSGEEGVERRARAVLRALGLLTRSVVIFDEFESILRRRRVGEEGRNIFSFLTPGMLPKLKDLNESAKRRAVAYVLVTNYIGELDDAAIRSGRFDEKMAIFPPDPLSRAGKLSMAVWLKGPELDRDWLKGEDVAERFRVAITQTSGCPIQKLAKLGFGFKVEDSPKAPVTRSAAKVPPRSGLVAFVCDSGEKPIWPRPEAVLEGVEGEGEDARSEYQQWAWVVDWDRKVARACSKDLFEALDEGPKKLPRVRGKTALGDAYESRRERHRGPRRDCTDY